MREPETKTLDGDLPQELHEDLLRTYKVVQMDDYGKLTSSVVERPAGKIAYDVKGEWEKRYLYKLVEADKDTCSLRAIIETTYFKK